MQRKRLTEKEGHCSLEIRVGVRIFGWQPSLGVGVEHNRGNGHEPHSTPMCSTLLSPVHTSFIMDCLFHCPYVY